jgi:hypothetical protein
MIRILPRIGCLLILALAFSACNAGSNTSPNPSQAAETETVVKLELPPEITPTPSPPPDADQTPAEPPGENPEQPATDSNPAPTGEADGISTVTSEPGTTKTAPPAGRAPGPLCNDAVFVDDVTIPDMTVLAPGQHFRKIWEMRNTGTCKWTTSYAIGFSHGNSMGGHDTALPNEVGPGGTVDVYVDMTAPTVLDWYGGFWRLKTDTGNYFGDFVYVSIMVSNDS